MKWRSINDNDNVNALELACLQVDNPYAIPLAQTHARTVATLCAEDDNRLVAAAWLTSQFNGIHLHGFVHPQQRNQGLGRHILKWAEQQALTHHHMLHIRSEANTEQANTLYQAQGFERYLAEEIMRFDLKTAIAERTLPDAYSVHTWSAESGPDFYKAYIEAFSDRGMDFKPPAQDDWIEWMADEEQFRADLSFVVKAGDEPVGFLSCEVDLERDLSGLRRGWVSQVGVRPQWRKQGIAAALITRMMQTLKSEGFDYTLLHVNINNPDAIAAYEKLNFELVGRRARYSKALA